ncbi:MGMT family protein [Dethiobacter alkaliphilus]|uniref:Methylated-DNA-(Protein)-cysteine S-methyltransferase DNA binding protein n=1 Tax=Dethiobacter alkaliphilus AHT 1 TaxID=555088 RepID=C0GDI7_DETAL|nr:MGMT family protein [Dethiobacter alkaliphilus]EEG78708.1 Methylated-DNA-(protein)-cysteine S-methyltransferase DNA binding protein [Dethiobacter alkaliphilus AHT 1]
MRNLFSPLFARIKKKYVRFPVSCGIVPEIFSPTQSCYSRAQENTVLSATYTGAGQLESFLNNPHLPDVVCIAASSAQRSGEEFAQAIQTARQESIPVIVTETEAVLAALGLPPLRGEELGKALTDMGFDLRPEASVCPEASLAAITGYFYLNNEYEIVGRNKNVVPLLLEEHPLFSFVRRIPYGEVATYAEVAKELGLQWNERMVMTHLRRLPAGADVPGHRLVDRDGRLSEIYPGGVSSQRERLKWELVPFADREHVFLERARWTRTKYRPLTNYLRHATAEVSFLEMHLSEIEQVIGAPLPKAARRLGTWWKDDKPHSWIWQEAGWKVTGVNLQQEMVAFMRMDSLN